MCGQYSSTSIVSERKLEKQDTQKRLAIPTNTKGMHERVMVKRVEVRRVLILGYCNQEDILVYVRVHFLHKLSSSSALRCGK